jgi:hypothetical protein
LVIVLCEGGKEESEMVSMVILFFRMCGIGFGELEGTGGRG